MEASSQLTDATGYQKCHSAFLQKVNKEIKDILRDMLNRKEIDKKNYGLPYYEKTTIKEILLASQNT